MKYCNIYLSIFSRIGKKITITNNNWKKEKKEILPKKNIFFNAKINKIKKKNCIEFLRFWRDFNLRFLMTVT